MSSNATDTAAPPRTERPQVNELELQRIVLVLALRDHAIPEHMHGGLLRYVLEGIIPGDFLLALLCNDLAAAQAHADAQNAEAFTRWVDLLKTLPTKCWGHPRSVADWSIAEGLAGRLGDATPKATPIIPSAPSNRPQPSVLLALSADITKRVNDATRHLGEILARIPDGITADEIRWALNDLAVARTSCDALAAECAKAVR